MPAENLDDEYHEYLWGAPSPRSFARNALVARTKQGIPRNVSSLLTR